MSAKRCIAARAAVAVVAAGRAWTGVGGLAALLIFSGAALPAGAEPLKLDSLKVGTKIYHKITVLGASETDLYFKHSHGIANVKLKYLEPEMQKRFDYDPRAAEEAERRQIQEDSAYHETVALEITTRAQKRMKTARDAAASTDDSLADPISSQSLLNQPAPKLEVDQWLGASPVTDGKAVLVFFWTTWSVPCRKAIPDLNAWQKQFRDQLVVVGISPQDQNDVANFSEVPIEFPLAADPNGKLISAAGVTSVPQALLIDAKGIVRYQGHPAALDAAKLKKLLVKPAA